MIKVQVIIDGNFLLHRAVFILKRNTAIREDLESVLNNDIKKITRAQGFGFNRIFFVSDMGISWRKSIYQEYKDRKKDDSIEWNSVYEIYERFKGKLSKRRDVRILQSKGVEGDDFISYIVKRGNVEGYSSVIVASDIDIHQVIAFDLVENWINMQWNYRFSDEKLYLPENYQLFIENLKNFRSDDIFSLGNETEFAEYIKRILIKAKVNEIRSEESLFRKIVFGDDSDNIKSILRTTGREIDNEKGRGIGKDGSAAVYKIYKEAYPEVIDFHSDIFVERLAEVATYYRKISTKEARDEVARNVIFNRRMVCLDPKYMPVPIFEAMSQEYEIKSIPLQSPPDTPETDYLDEIEDIAEEFRMENTGEKFSDDDFWKVDGKPPVFDPNDFWKI